MKRIQKILVANRGEIAVRIMGTCRKMGIATVAVFSDADADAVHVRAADEAVRIGPAPSAESYLVVEKILDAAKRTGADAIHPGFGFLSERAEFAEACAAAGLTFIGPSPDAIRKMGLKKEAKAIAIAADVPVVPGDPGDDQDPNVLAKKADEVGFPVLIKASAGGGGKGMRVCRESSQVLAAIEGAKREAEASFGDGTLLIEKYIDHPRHVEIQILGDTHGNVVHLFERECSIQRRHQKIIEETPSMALTPELRKRMGDAAVSLGKAIGYSNAGTVEFIVAPDGNFYFLEVNTRLQVEHPITECVTGVDIVREQIRVAQGEALSITQAEVQMNGAAVECRIYAEEPGNQFLPASGTIVDWNVPDVDGLRVDTGVESGTEVSIYYDPMVAKIITHGPTRSEATQRMVRALEGLSVQGIETNREFLIATLRHPDYAAGDIHTHFIDEHMQDALTPKLSVSLVSEAAVAAALGAHALRAESSALPSVRSGYRNNPLYWQSVNYVVGDLDVPCEYQSRRDGAFDVRVGPWQAVARVVSRDGADLRLEVDGVRRSYRVISHGGKHFVQCGGRAVKLVEQARFPDLEAQVPLGGCIAPMPGKVVTVDVAEGQVVAEGERLLVLEAMKMEHTIGAPNAGTIEQILVKTGDQVDADQLLVVVSEAE